MSKDAILLVSVGIDPAYQAMARLAIRSARDAGAFDGEIIMLTDHADAFDGLDATIVPVDGSAHLKRFPALAKVNRHWAENLRVFADLYYDFTPHDRLLYLDTDILCHRPLAPIFDAIGQEHLHFAYAPCAGWQDSDSIKLDHISPFLRKGVDVALLNTSPVALASPTGVCSGSYGMAGKQFAAIMKPWRELMLAHFEAGEEVTDQMSLNECLLDERISGAALPNELIAYPLWPLLGKQDRREMKARAEPAIYHFNPLPAEKKLGYMKAFLAFGPEAILAQIVASDG